MTLAAVIGVVLIFVGVPLGLLMLRDRLSRRAHAATLELEQEAWQRRIDAPDIAAIEKAIGAALPEALVLNARSGAARRTNLVARINGTDWIIQNFLPLDGGSAGERWEGMPPRAVAFACDTFGNQYFVVPGTPDGQDPPVQLFVHDGDEVLRVSPSLSKFLAALEPESL